MPLNWKIKLKNILILPLFRQRFEDEDEEDFMEDPYADSLSAAIAESAALAERERKTKQVQTASTTESTRKKLVKKDTYFSDEDEDWRSSLIM